MRLFPSTIAFRIAIVFTLSIVVLVSYLFVSFKNNIEETLTASEKEKAAQTVNTIAPLVELYLYLNQDEITKKTLDTLSQNSNIESVRLIEIGSGNVLYRFTRQKENSENDAFVIAKILQDGLTGQPQWELEVRYSSVFLHKLGVSASSLLNKIVLMVALVFLFLLAILLYFLSPLKKVANAIKSYKPGGSLNLPKKCDTVEVGTIVHALKDMEAKIVRYESELKDVNETLELKIGEKTKELQFANMELEGLNSLLEERVDEQTRQILESERLLVQQSKLAAMGEMIGAIAHQWRQPLNALGIMVQDVRMAYNYSELNEGYIDVFENDAMSQIQFMSKTIDDFRNFFKPSKEKSLFTIHKVIKDSINIIEAQAKAANIECRFEGDDFEGFGYPGEFSQVILNLISNAKDAIIQRRENIENPALKGHIIIKTIKDGNYGVITVEDNGCGIPEHIMEKIYDPYFSTKEQGKGTGIGLYMSKLIIENHIGGSLSAVSDKNGSVFTIRFLLVAEEG